MSDPIKTTLDPFAFSRRVSRLVLVMVAVIVLLVLAGFVLGDRLPWGAYVALAAVAVAATGFALSIVRDLPTEDGSPSTEHSPSPGH
ncbi:MAG: hypothetical protein ACRCYU_01965 [Nocardioides sp.]